MSNGVLHLLATIVVVSSMVWWHSSELLLTVFKHQFSGPLKFDVVVGVLSARHHFNERQVLRDTWAGYAQKHDGVLLKFIVGDEACPTPPEYLRSPYGCTPSNLSATGTEVTAVSTTAPSLDKMEPVSLPNKISFKVHHPVVVQRLGLLWSAESLVQSTYSVTLFDEINKESVAHVSFTEDGTGHRVGDYLYKPIESFILPEGFEGSIIVTSKDPETSWMSGPRGPVTMETGGNVISYFQDTWTEPDGDNLPFHREELPEGIVCNFVFVVHEPDRIAKLVEKKDERTIEWTNEMQRTEEQLKDEIGKHGDIVLVEALDVYQNIPLKMVQFHKWMSENIDFNYFIKTDDDCFLNLELVMKDLESGIPTSTTPVWWGNFRYNWGVDRRGKWAEHSYPSTAYPAFACGSGNLVSADIVHWIAMNYRYLHLYQGEDVTMAIWLAAILPTYLDDKRWICDDECTPGMLVSAEHTPDEIKQLWSNWVECGNPCQCSQEPP